MVNERLLKDFVSRKIDEDNLIFDLYGHNAIEVYFKSEQEAKQKKKMDIEYFSYKEKDLENFAAMNEKIEESRFSEINDQNQCNKDMRNKVLKRKLTINNKKKIEPWFSKEIVKCIKERRYYNRKRRNERDEQLKEDYLKILQRKA